MSQQMISVALIGLDGAGKSTVGREVERMLPIPLKYIYMGINLDSSNLVLPTTRALLELKRLRGKRPVMAGPSSPNGSNVKAKGIIKRTAAGFKSGFQLTTLVGEEALRFAVASYYRRLGYIVLFDRHFYFDYYTKDIATPSHQRSLGSRLHGFMLERVYPKPDLAIYLDAPAELLFARKGEGTIEWLESRRQEYLGLGDHFKNLIVLDATRPLEVVVQEVSNLISECYGRQAGTIPQSTTIGSI